MSSLRTLFASLILLQTAAGQDQLQVDLYALPAKIHTKLDLALFVKPESFLTTLKKIEGASAVEKPISFSQPLNWGEETRVEKLERVSFTASYDLDSTKLKGATKDSLEIGYRATWTATQEDSKAASLTFSFTWNPLCKEDRISGGGREDWFPSHPTLHTTSKFLVKQNEPTLAALWLSPIETTFNPKEETWLYLLVVRRP